MSCLVNNANPVIFTFNFQPNNSPNDKKDSHEQHITRRFA